MNIPDANFKAYLVGNTAINTNNDTEISVAEAQAFTGIINCSNNQITDLTGISSFVALTSLHCSYNSLPILDVSGLSNLEYLSCYNNSLSSLDVSGLSSLTELYCYSNSLPILDVSGLSNLYYLKCSTNPSLSTICVATTHNTSGENGWTKDASASWSTTCSPLSFEESESKASATVLKAYNLHGQEVPADTRGEVIILLYDNGSREKTYVAE